MAEMILKYWETKCGRGNEDYYNNDPECGLAGSCEDFLPDPDDVKRGIINIDCIFHILEDKEICRRVKWYEIDEYGIEYSVKANPKKNDDMLFVDVERIEFLSIDGRVIINEEDKHEGM